jgi:hypothetical protein
MLKYGGLVHNPICAPLRTSSLNTSGGSSPTPWFQSHIPPGYHAEHGGGIFRHALGG